MNWTEPKPPTQDVSFYHHVTCDTPLGRFIIEWKGWKDNPDYGIELNDKYIGTEYSLDKAKKACETYLIDVCEELNYFIAAGKFKPEL